MRKKNNLRKMIMVLSLIACSFGLVACSNDAESKNEQLRLPIPKMGFAP